MQITDEELNSMYLWWLEHYTAHGEKHYSDTPDWKIAEIYFNEIVSRVLQDLPEMDDEEEEAIIEKLGNL